MDEDLSDESLMLKFSRGNADAFEVVYQRHKSPLYGFILRQCEQRFVDELFQDIWLNVINARFNYKVKASFKTWLYHIARNRIIDHYRRQNIRAVDNDPEQISKICGASDSQPENQLEASSQLQRLMNAIAALPNEQKEVFLLRQEAGLTVDEIAITTGVSYETAKSRLRYAIKKLRQQLETDDEP